MNFARRLLINSGIAIALLFLSSTLISYASRGSATGTRSAQVVSSSAQLGRAHSNFDRQTRIGKSAKLRSGTASVVSRSQIAEAIRSSADYLSDAIDEEGKFVYRVNLDPAVKVRPRYNVLRHAGTVFALSRILQRSEDAATLDALRRSARYLKESFVAAVPGHDELLAVWSKPELNGGHGPLQAKLGGAGLALVALLGLEEVQPGSTSLDELRGLARFILFMQKNDGGFYSKYIPAEGGRSDRWTSLYYPGEAVLGLVSLYEQDRSPEWLEAAAKGMAFLAHQRAGKQRVEADHWALIATAKLLARYDDSRMSVPRDLIINHAVQICESILAGQARLTVDATQSGGFVLDGRTCPTATRLEGLLAALSFLPSEQGDLKRRIDSAVAAGIAFLLRAQVREGKFTGAMPRAICRLPENHPRYSRAFNRRATEIRIDYVQHAVCAMLDFETQEAQSETERQPEFNTASL